MKSVFLVKLEEIKLTVATNNFLNLIIWHFENVTPDSRMNFTKLKYWVIFTAILMKKHTTVKINVYLFQYSALLLQ
jgi:hypothetical protein